MPKNEWKNHAYLNLIECYWQSLVKLLFSSFRKPGLCLSWIVGCTTCFFYKQHYFSTQPQRFIAFSWIELLQNLVKVVLDTYKHLHTETFFYSLYLSPCLDPGQFMLYLCDLHFIFIFIFIVISLYNLTKTGTLSFLDIL